jgi:hypothetical protein
MDLLPTVVVAVVVSALTITRVVERMAESENVVMGDVCRRNHQGTRYTDMNFVSIFQDQAENECEMSSETVTMRYIIQVRSQRLGVPLEIIRATMGERHDRGSSG